MLLGIGPDPGAIRIDLLFLPNLRTYDSTWPIFAWLWPPMIAFTLIREDDWEILTMTADGTTQIT